MQPSPRQSNRAIPRFTHGVFAINSTQIMVSLESSKLFQNLSPMEMEKVRQAARELTFGAGQVIFKEGDQGDGMYVVKTGIVQISANVSPTERRVLTRVGPGDIFGEMAIIDKAPRSASASAEIETIVYFIPSADFLKMLEQVPILALTLLRDVSRRLREFNQHYVQEVLQAERFTLVGRFAGAIVHDLKNPLNIIGLSADLAAMEKSTPESRLAAKNRIRRQVERISNMVNELLEFTRGSQISFVHPAVDYGVFIHQVVEEIRAELTIKSVEIEFLNQPPSRKVQLNPQRLSRVFHNLMHNAADAMGTSGGTIKLRFDVTDCEVTTAIEDTGPGIPPEMMGRLFQAFATYGKAHGTGLGLSICKKIVEDHKGKIFARNQETGGAVFGFTIPVLPVTVSENTNS
ncbi:MAG: Cyclic nucleotide-binding protein [Verrucomicrobiales bacterium]|nr:Cyclic nucleotide-binding protein [Verrucomicrobiales bacterium]